MLPRPRSFRPPDFGAGMWPLRRNPERGTKCSFSYKNVPRPYSELRQGLPPAPAAASLPELGRVPFGSVGGSEKGSGDGLLLLGSRGPRGAEPVVPDAGRARPEVSLSLCGRLHWDINRDHSTSWRWENLQALREAAGRLGQFPKKLFTYCISGCWPVFPT